MDSRLGGTGWKLQLQEVGVLQQEKTGSRVSVDMSPRDRLDLVLEYMMR